MRRGIIDWQEGLGMPARVAAWLPPIGVLAASFAMSTSDDGDIRAGIFPFAMAFAVASFLAPVAAVRGLGRERASVWLRSGAAWTALALASVAAGFSAIAVGALLGIEEDAIGLLAWVVVAAVAFGILSITPATALLAVGVSRDRLLPRFGRVALWTAAPLLPLVMIVGGLAEGTAETVGSVTLLLSFGAAWVAVGAAVAVADRRPATRAEFSREGSQ